MTPIIHSIVVMKMVILQKFMLVFLDKSPNFA